MSLSTPRFDTVRLQVLRRLAVEKGTRRTFSSFAKTLGYLGVNVCAARERLQKSWVSTQRLDHDSYLEVMLDLLMCTPVESPLEEEEKTTASSPRFDWPVVEMAQYEIMLERESGSRIDVDNVLVLTGLPKLKEAGTLRAFMLNVLSRTGIAAPVLCTFPKDSSTGALKGIVFLALPSAEDASRALNLFTRRILWPSHSPTLTVQTLLDALEEQTPFDSFDLWRGRFFRQFQSQHSYSYSPPKTARKRKGALRSLYRIEKQLHQKLADRSILSRHQWKTAEEALVSALDVNSVSLLEAVRLAVENHVALLTALARTAGDDYEDEKPEHLVLLEEVQQILAYLIGVSTSEAPQIYAATTSILSLSLVSLAVEQNECKREAEERLMMASTQVSEHLQELSLMDVKCTELDEARRVMEEKVRILDRQLKISEEHRIKALSAQSTCRLSAIDKAQRSMGELMQMGDGELLTLLADLDSYVSKVRTARDQVLARQHAENSLCCVCRDREKTILLLPCRHLCACAFCAASLGDCPVCRCTIREKIGVFSS